MCRLCAFPPQFPRQDAIEILRHFENNNTDGTGAAWIEDGKFLVEKYPKALTKVLNKHRFLRHMPHNGWTIAHLRAASKGDVRKVNTHPFIAGQWALCHNGTFDEYKIGKLALQDRVKFEGDTDSEVAANLINVAGPKRFAETVDMSGVFLALNIKGDLWAVKTSGDLEMLVLTKGERSLMASKFNSLVYDYDKTTEAQIGWYHFDSDGRYIKHKKLRESFYPYKQINESCCATKKSTKNGDVVSYTPGRGPGGPSTEDYDYTSRWYMEHL